MAAFSSSLPESFLDHPFQIVLGGRSAPSPAALPRENLKVRDATILYVLVVTKQYQSEWTPWFTDDTKSPSAFFTSCHKDDRTSSLIIEQKDMERVRCCSSVEGHSNEAKAEQMECLLRRLKRIEDPTLLSLDEVPGMDRHQNEQLLSAALNLPKGSFCESMLEVKDQQTIFLMFYFFAGYNGQKIGEVASMFRRLLIALKDILRDSCKLNQDDIGAKILSKPCECASDGEEEAED